MVTDTTVQSEIPRVSSNQLGQLAFSTEAQKWRMLWDMKFGNPHSAPYYQAALSGILGSFSEGRFDHVFVRQKVQTILATEPNNSNHAHRLRNNAEMLRRFDRISDQIDIARGDHQVIRQNATMQMEDVVISVRPEIITRSAQTGLVSFAKFRFSKSPVSLDVSEIVLLLLIHYSRQPQFHAENFDLEHTLLVDCYAMNVVRGHNLPRVRQNQLEAALADVRRIWPLLRVEDPGGREVRRHQFRN
jgi:hypothetical protein